MQLKLLRQRDQRKVTCWPARFLRKCPRWSTFYKNHLPFDLTGAQKRVIHDIYKDFLRRQADEPAVAGRRGLGQNHRGLHRHADGGRQRRPKLHHGPDRDSGRPALHRPESVRRRVGHCHWQAHGQHPHRRAARAARGPARGHACTCWWAPTPCWKTWCSSATWA